MHALKKSRQWSAEMKLEPVSVRLILDDFEVVQE